MKCLSSKCGYEWQPRVPRPKVCPKCHRFIDDPVLTPEELQRAQEARDYLLKLEKEGTLYDNSDKPGVEKPETSR